MKIDSVAKLRDIVAEPTGRSVIKTLTALEQHSIHFLRLSPFAVISTFNSAGDVDTSPRGGEPGFVKVLDDKHVVIADAKGNRRQDSQINIIETGRIATLFFIPGVNETLRINGSASINDDEQILKLFTAEKQPALTYIEINIEEVFLHCAKALMRSKLWSAQAQIPRDQFPTMSRMLNDQTNSDEPEESQQAMEARYQADL